MRLDDGSGDLSATQVPMQPQRVFVKRAHAAPWKGDKCDAGVPSAIEEDRAVLGVTPELVDAVYVVQRHGKTGLAEANGLGGPVSQKGVAQHRDIRGVRLGGHDNDMPQTSRGAVDKHADPASQRFGSPVGALK
jgi:hypothetical protein